MDRIIPDPVRRRPQGVRFSLSTYDTHVMSTSLSYSNVLFVCHANTSRSVMAHHILLRLLSEEGSSDVKVRSGGIAPYARDGMLVSMDARLALADIGIEVSREEAATDLKVQRHLFDEADLIIVMTEEQRAMLSEFPEVNATPVFTLREFAEGSGNVEDPAGQGDDVFRDCCEEIHRCLIKAVPRILGTAHTP